MHIFDALQKSSSDARVLYSGTRIVMYESLDKYLYCALIDFW